MKRMKILFGAFSLLVAVSLISNTEQLKAAGPDGCSWGYREVNVHWWMPFNDKKSKYCDCTETGRFESGTKCDAASS